MFGYDKIDNEELVAKAINAHYNKFDVEAFTIIFESILMNLKVLIYSETHQLDNFNKKYFELTNIAEKEHFLRYEIIFNLHLFRFYRNKIVHSIVYGKPIECKLIDMWFKRGRILNSDIKNEANNAYFENGLYEEDIEAGIRPLEPYFH